MTPGAYPKQLLHHVHYQHAVRFFFRLINEVVVPLLSMQQSCLCACPLTRPVLHVKLNARIVILHRLCISTLLESGNRESPTCPQFSTCR